jgi:hypothetical protein
MDTDVGVTKGYPIHRMDEAIIEPIIVVEALIPIYPPMVIRYPTIHK